MKKFILALFLSISPLSASFANDVPTNQQVYKTFSLDFVESPIRLVLQAIGDNLPKGLIISDSIQGNVSIKLVDVSALEALDAVLKLKGLQRIDKNGSYLIVSPSDNSYSESLTTKTIKLKYAKAKDIKDFLSNNQKLLSDSGSILYDVRTNTVVVTETDTSVDRLVSIINSLDIKLDQVEIEAKIIEVSTDFSKDLGIQLSSFLSSNKFNSSASFDGKLKNNSSFGFSLLTGSFNFDLFFDALEKDGLVKVVSTPKILTVDNGLARVSTGTEIPYQTSTITSTGTTTSTSFKSALLSLEVTPSISSDGNVEMSLSVTKDSPNGYAENGEIIISTNSLSTSVVVSDGQTVVLGGVFVDTTSSNKTKVPFVSNIPFLGSLFRNSHDSKDKKELLVFLTPRVVK